MAPTYLDTAIRVPVDWKENRSSEWEHIWTSPTIISFDVSKETRADIICFRSRKTGEKMHESSSLWQLRGLISIFLKHHECLTIDVRRESSTPEIVLVEHIHVRCDPRELFSCVGSQGCWFNPNHAYTGTRLYWVATKKHTLSINTFQLPHVVFSFVIEKKKVLFLHLNFLWSLVLLCASEYHMFTPHELFKTGQKFSIDSFNGCFADMACKRDISHFKEN